MLENNILFPPPQSQLITREVNESVTPLIVEKLTVQAWPNSSESQFNLKVTGVTKDAVELKVYDINGKVVYTERGAAAQVFRFGNGLTNGVYLVEVRQGDQRATHRLIKQ